MAANSPNTKKDLTESEFLAQEGERASKAMGQTTSDIASLLKGAFTAKMNEFKQRAHPEGPQGPSAVSGALGDHPWITLGAAAAAGFVAASALTPSKDETLSERLKSLMPEKKPDHADLAAALAAYLNQAAPAATGGAVPKKPGMASGVMGHVMDAVKTALVSTVTSAVSAKVVQQPTGDQGGADGNGHGNG